MRFDRSTKILPVGITPRRLSAARRAVQRDKYSWALFPEFVKHQTPEERIQEIDKGLILAEIERRQEQANKWRENRRRLARMPEPLRSGVLRYWNAHGWMPGAPGYLGGLLHEAETGRFDPPAKFAEIERCRLLGRLTREVTQSTPLPQSPLDGNKERTFLSLHVAGQIARAIAPHLFPPDKETEEDVFAICRRP